MLSSINDSSIALLKTLLLSNLGSHHHQVTKKLCMLGCSLVQASQSVAVLWYHKEVNWSHWVDVAEGKGLGRVKRKAYIT